MASTTFVDRRTPIMADWLNDVNTNVYELFANVKQYGATGDGTTDDTDAFEDAIAANAGKTIFIPPGTYRLTRTISMASQGMCLYGESQTNTILLIDQTTGPGINISQPYCQLIGLNIKASSTRANYTTSTTYALATGLFGVQIYNNGGFMTQTRLDRVWSINHPNNGFYMGGEGADSMFINCAAYSNRGHGFYFDGRTLLGGSTSRCGLVSLIHCRATENGGNAVNADDVTAPCYRMWFHNFETINNAWNTSISGLINAEFKFGGENQHISQCAFSDRLGDTYTVTQQGQPRIAKTTLSTGVYIGNNSRGITMTQNRFISTRRGVETHANPSGLHLYVRGAYFSQQQLGSGYFNQDYGFIIGTGHKCVDIEVEDSMPVDYMIASPDTGGRIKIGQIDGMVYGNNVGIVFKRNGYHNATIASNSVNAQSTFVNLLAPGATTLVEIVFGGGSNNLPPGEVLHFYNASGYTITLQHGTSDGYIRTKSGSNVTVAAGGRFSIMTDPSGNPFEI